VSPEQYFAEERRGGAIFLALGLAAVALSMVLAAGSTPYRGMIPPLALLGLVEVGVGGAMFARAPGRADALRKGLEADADGTRAREGRRMQRVLASFRVCKVAEIVFLTAGVTLLMLFSRRTPWNAAGLGLLVQASVLLVLDRLGERRARDYAAALAGSDLSARTASQSAPR